MPPKKARRHQLADVEDSFNSSVQNAEIVDTLLEIKDAMMRMKPHIQPKQYSSGDFGIWLTSFNLFADQSGLVGADRVNYLLSFLDGDAAKIAKNLPIDENFEDALLERLKPRLTPREYRNVLKSRTHKDTETPRIYADSLLHLSRKAFSEDFHFDLALDHFLDTVRLPSGLTRAALLQKQFYSIDEAVKFVQSWEIASKCSSVSNPVNSVSDSRLEERLDRLEKQIAECCGIVKQNQKVLRCFRCSKLGHISKDCSHKNLTCFKCKKVGHIASFCRSGSLNLKVTAMKGDGSQRE